MKMISMLISLLVILSLVAGCTKSPAAITQKEAGEKLQVATTFYPLYDLTRSIAGDKAKIVSLVPSNVGPHDYEPTPGDVQKLTSADVFVTMGLEFEEIEQELLKSANKNIKVVHAESGISLLMVTEEDEDEEEQNGVDPHIWLSPKNAKIMTNNIKNGLVAVDPENANFYLDNAAKLSVELDNLGQDFKKGLSQCSKNVVLVNHNAFSYLARDYGFELITIHGLEPEVEPTPGQLQELIDKAKEHKIKYVFYEELVDPRVAQTIANEVGAEVLELSPLEGGNPSDTYVSLMHQNLDNLRIALECE